MALFQKVSGGSAQTGRLSFEAFDEFGGQAVDAEVQEAALTGETDFVEAAQEAERVSADLDDAQQSMNVADSVQDQIDVQGQVENTTETEAMLAETARATATAALGVAPGEAEEVISGESWVGGRLSTEGFKEFLASVWVKIKEFVGNIIARIKMTWKKFFNGTARLVKRAKALKDALKNKKKDLKSNEAEIKPIAALVGTESGKFDTKYIMDNLNDVTDVSVNFGKDILGAVDGAIKAAQDTISVDTAKKIDSEDALLEIVEKFAEQAVAKFSTKGKEYRLDSRFGKAKVRYEPFPFGNKAVFAIMPESDSATTVINGLTMRLETLYKSWNFKGKEDKHKPLSFADIEKIPDAVEKAAKALGDFFEKDAGKAHDNIGKFEKDIGEFVKKAGELEGAYPKKYAQIVQRSYVVPTHALRAAMSTASHLVSTLGAYVTLGEVSLAQYEDDKKDK